MGGWVGPWVLCQYREFSAFVVRAANYGVAAAAVAGSAGCRALTRSAFQSLCETCLKSEYYMITNYGFWNIHELKDELRKRGGKVAWRKHELVESRECNL